VGGQIADELGGRYLFYLNLPIGLAIAGMTWALLIGRQFKPRCLRFDYIW
jgi:DHA2 family multidrug resistance protein